MNAAKSTNDTIQAEDFEPMVVETVDNTPKSVSGEMRGARSRYMLILGIALASAWITFSTLTSINEINTQLDQIRAHFLLPVR